MSLHPLSSSSFFVPSMADCSQPSLFSWLLSLSTVVTDWNDTLAPAFRKGVNFFVPCYYQAFPPYRQQFLSPDTCPVEQFTAPSQPLSQMRPKGV